MRRDGTILNDALPSTITSASDPADIAAARAYINRRCDDADVVCAALGVEAA